MNIDPREISALISAHSDPSTCTGAPRVDMYAGIHKALRAL